MALYIPTTFGASGGGTIIASGSTSISGAIGMNSGWPLQQDYFVSNSITYSYWMWQGIEDTKTNVATFDIFSGSTLNARLVAIGGGGGLGGGQAVFEPLNGWVAGGLALGGGGAGGVVEFNNFPLLPGHYNIVAGAGGAGISGISSSITLPLAIAQPFTSSYVVAYGGGRGGYADRSTNSKGTSGGSVGGNTQVPGNSSPVVSNPVLGAGLGGRSGGDQGRTSGEIPQSTSPNEGFSFTATGGGGFNASSAASTAGKYITDGGSGSLISIYPYNYNTASYVATGGGAAGLPGNDGATSQSWQYSQQGGNAWGIGSGASVSASSFTYEANYGMVYLEYPYYFNPYPKLATDGLMFRLSQISLLGNVWFDLSGNGNNALVSGSTLVSSSTGFNFNGTNNYLTFPVSMSGYPVSQSFTLQWYGTKMNNGNVWYHASGSGNPTGYDYGAGIGMNDWALYQTGSNKTLYTLVQTNFGGTGGNVATNRLYINDSIFYVEYDLGITRQYEPFQVPNIPWQFGYGTFSSSFDPQRVFLSGSASDILLYNRPLDVSEIANNYRYFQTLPTDIVSIGNGYRIAQCGTTASIYVNTTSSLAINDVIKMTNYSSSNCYYVSQSVTTSFSYPTVFVSQSFVDCANCIYVPPSAPLYVFDATLSSSYSGSNQYLVNQGTLGTNWKLSVQSSLISASTDCAYIEGETLSFNNLYSQLNGVNTSLNLGSVSTFVYCIKSDSIGNNFNFYGQGPNVNGILYTGGAPLQLCYRSSKYIETTPSNTIGQFLTSGSFETVVIRRARNTVELLSSQDNFTQVYVPAVSASNLYTELGQTYGILGSDYFNIKKISLYGEDLTQAQLLEIQNCPNC
jgi:hypothetical protein